MRKDFLTGSGNLYGATGLGGGHFGGTVFEIEH
jgi:hypothetical protein